MKTESRDKLNRVIRAQQLIIVNLKSRVDKAERELTMRKKASRMQSLMKAQASIDARASADYEDRLRYRRGVPNYGRV